MKLPVRESSVGSAASEDAHPRASSETDESRGLARDLFALATLPASWMGVEPERIGESLLAAIDATIRPALCYVRLSLDTAVGAKPKPIELAHLGQGPAQADVAAELGERISSWAQAHGPDEPLHLSAASLPGPLRVSVQALGADAASGGVLAVGFTETNRPSERDRMVLSMAANQLIVACKNATLQKEADEARAEAQALHRVTQALAAELDPHAVIQKTTDAARRLTGAQFAAFFHTETNDQGEQFLLYTLSGAPREAFERFEMPRSTPLFGPTFHGTQVVRIDDVRADPRYGKMAPHHGMPKGHLPVRSYLAVPVRSRSGEVLGGLFFGHPEPAVFDERAERMAIGIARQAAVAVDNARLFAQAEQELAQRKRAEEALREQKENLETLLETLPVGVFIAHDPQCRRVVGNRQANELLRRTPGANLSMTAPPDERPRNFRVCKDGSPVPPPELAVQRAARGEIVQDEELDLEFDDGTVVHVLISARPLYDAAGQPRGAVASILDITSLKEAETALRVADRRKDEFLATLAHELRNPLAPIRSALDVLRHADGDVRRLKSARDTMGRQLDSMVRLVDDLLDLSRITRDRLELRKEHVELRSVIHQAVETCRPLADGEEQVIEVRLPRDPIDLYADRTRLAQVFANLLHNACKYTAGPGTIKIGARRDEDGVLVSISDDGVGIAPENLSGIFDMFAQVDYAPGRSRGGLGIGLTLVKRIVEMHGGSIVAHSDGLGCGSEFGVRLPLSKSDDRRDEPATTAQQPAGPHRILVVDDNRDAAETLGMLLEIGGHEVHLAYDGRTAIDVAERVRPNLILLDIGMPDLDGLEVCREIRKSSWGVDTSIVALSGWGQQEDRRKTAEAGFDDHLVKPVDSAVLSKLLRALPTR